jgi:uncharacterized protein (UPF0264 family)
VGLLASVADLAEVVSALTLGADIIDLKDPKRGALGAWPRALLPAAVAAVAGRVPVSATVGDLPMEPGTLLNAALTTTAAGVDYVKVGLFGGHGQDACITALAAAVKAGARLVAVLMADRRPELDVLPVLARAGFAGVMLDTADKGTGGLRRHLAPRELAAFVEAARALGLVTGLAGSLKVDDVGPLAALGPDYLGFRGALCGGPRTASLDPAAFAKIRAALDASAPARAA